MLNCGTLLSDSDKKTIQSLTMANMWVTYNGFGYDHVNDKYKVLFVLCSNSAHFSEKVTRIYTFGGNTWTTIRNFPCPPARYNKKFVSGTLNWVIGNKDVGSNQAIILSLDLEKETYNEVLLPKHDVYFKVNLMLGVLGNYICVCFDYNKTNWDFWLMKKYGVVESWMMMIHCQQLQHCVQNTFDFVEPLFFENGIILLRTFNKFVLYNLNNGNLECPLICYSILLSQYIHHEGLVSPQ
jgi:F-box interacting protein